MCAYVIFDSQVEVTRCPDGIARGAYDLATRGTGLLITCWPDKRNQLPDLPWNHVRGVPLWQQEMSILRHELTPRIAAILHWEKLWRAIEKVPIEEAIENDNEDEGRTLEAKQIVMRHRIWGRDRKASTDVDKSVFCAGDLCSACKQIDCGCECHQSGQQ